MQDAHVLARSASSFLRALLPAIAAVAAVALVVAAAASSCSGAPAHRQAGPTAHFCPEPNPVREDWRHDVRGGPMASSMGAANHAAIDAVVPAGSPIVITGKLAYGEVSKDLEDEWVAMWMNDGGCTTWREVVRGVTDDDGRVRFELPAATVRGPGPHRYRLVVLGDLSYAEAGIWAVTPGTEAVLFDVDATLTTGDFELVEQMAGGSVPPMRPGANEVVQRWAALGYLPVYLTGRHYILRQATARWLADHGFPPGPLVTVDRLRDSMPGEGGVGEFKHAALVDLMRRGLSVVRAYGNASTDACAYARAGVAADRTYMVDGARVCAGFDPPQTIESYIEHLTTLDGVTPAAHPGLAP